MDLSINNIQVIEFTKIYLAVFYSTVAAFYTLSVITKKRKHGKKLIFAGQRLGKTWWNHTAFRLFRITIWMLCLLRVLYPNIDNYLGMITYLQTPSIILLGLFLLTLGFVTTVLIHFSLGKEWRSGIDPSGPNTVISSGVYRFSRNPMFICIAMAQLGFFLALPCVFSLLCLLVGLTTLYSQTLAEELHLSEKFPVSYSAYAAKVRRWL